MLLRLSALQGDLVFLQIPYDGRGAAEIGMINILQQQALLHNPIHGDGIKSPQLQGRYKRDSGYARKKNINGVSGRRQVDLVVYSR